MIESVIRVVEYGQIQLGENRGVLVMMRGDNGGGEVGGGEKMSECRPTYTYHHTNEQNIVTEWMGIIRHLGTSFLPTSSSPRHNSNKKGLFIILALSFRWGLETFPVQPQKRAKIWNPCILGSCGIDYRNISGITRGPTWTSPCYTPRCVSNLIICWIFIILWMWCHLKCWAILQWATLFLKNK